MKLIFIYGAPSVGKYTIAKLLEKKTRYKNFHNHLSIELAKKFYDFGTQKFYKFSDKICYECIEEAARNNLDLITTFCYTHPNDDYFIKKIIKIIKKYDQEIVFIHIVASKNKLLERVNNKSRENLGKVTSKAKLRKLLEKCDYYTSFKTKEKQIKILNEQNNPKEILKKIINFISAE